jgi:predicted house-cleaning noncanonical NTP pyrophosphatase (MazG superfamily)
VDDYLINHVERYRGMKQDCEKLGGAKIPDKLATEIKKYLTKNNHHELDIPVKIVVDDSKMIEDMKNKLKQRKIQKQSKHNAFKRTIILD